MASTSSDPVEVVTFPSVISRLFRAWTAYQYALRAQMGGASTREKAAWFESVLADLFANNRNLQMDEVIDWIDELLYNEFDLVVEDGSVEWLADALVKCFGWLGNQRYEQVSALLARLPSDSAVSAATAQSSTTVDDAGDSDSGDDQAETAGSGSVPVVTTSNGAACTSNRETPGAQPSNNTGEPMDVSKPPDSDGWTTVAKKGKRK